MYKVVLEKDEMRFDMNTALSLVKACRFADVYKRHNPAAIFSVVNEENGDIEYQA